jgi:lysophospholipase L1-like esterase
MILYPTIFKVKLLTLGVLLFTLNAMEEINAQDWPNLEEYRSDNEIVGLPGKKEDRVVFMGNSITIGWLHKMPEFFEGKSYINRGIGGQTTPQMLIRFRQDVVALKPKVVVILAGTNDIAGNTGPSTIKMIADNIFSMVDIAEEHKIKVVISSVLPVYDYPWKPGLEPAQKIVSLNKLLKKYAKKNGHTYLDYFNKMADRKDGLKKDLGSDGVHPNKAGYAIMAPLAEKAIQKALK